MAKQTPVYGSYDEVIQTGRDIYAADAGLSDTYAITLDPPILEYTIGQVFNFYANTANTGAATLNVNSIGAKTIKKNHDVDLVTGDVEAGQMVTVIYDGTYFQMQGQSVQVLENRIAVLEDKYVRFLWFEEIGAGTSGTITPPTGGTIVLDQWAAGVDAVTSTLTTTRNPTYESAKTAGGTIITATLNVAGAWTISDTPSVYPIAILYVYDVKLINADRTKCLVEVEADQGLKKTDSPTFAGLALGSGSLTLTGSIGATGARVTKGWFTEIALTTDLTVGDGGTGASTLTDHGVLVGSGTDAITPLTVGTNGQVLVGSTGADPVFATITDGEGIDTTLGAGTLTIACEVTSTTNPGVVELATQAEVLAGTDTSRAVVPVDLWAKTAIDVNPKAFAQGINMTAAAAGSTGITVADDDDIDFGTGNFTLVWKGSVPDWTPAVDTVIVRKNANNIDFNVLHTTGKIRVNLNSTYPSSTVAPSLTNNTVHEIVAVIERVLAQQITYYVDGAILGTPVALAGNALNTVTNADILYINGLATERNAGIIQHVYAYNRALSAAEALSLYQNGIADADKWGSQTAMYTSNFTAGVDGWLASRMTVAGNIDGIGGQDDWLRCTCTNVAGSHAPYRNEASSIATLGKKYRIEFKYYIPSGQSNIDGFRVQFGVAVYPTTFNTLDAVTGVSFEITAASGTPGTAQILMYAFDGAADAFTDAGGDDVFYIKDVVITEIGATLALESEGIQPNPGQWLDSSSNKLHAWQPATGSSLTRYKKTFEIRGINTWSAAHEAQSVTMLTDASRAMLPTDCYITEIIGVITGTTIEDIIVGDGSDTDHWVAATTGLAAGTYSFAIANHISDGTNMEMVVDPDANFTGTIEWTIRGFIID